MAPDDRQRSPWTVLGESLLIGVLLAGSLGLPSAVLTPAHAAAPSPHPGADIEKYLRLQAQTLGVEWSEPAAQDSCPSLAQALQAQFDYVGLVAPLVPLVEPRLAEATACLLDALTQANRLRDEAFAGVDAARLVDYFGSDERDPSPLLATLDTSKMMEGAALVARAVDAALPALQAVPLGAGSPIDVEPILYVDTLGADNTHVLDYALTIELAGNDTYKNHAGGALIGAGGPAFNGPGIKGNNSTFQHVINLPLDHQIVIGGQFEDADLILANSLVLDVSGDDSYGAKEAPGIDAGCTSEPVVRAVAIQGAGVAGLGMLIDLAGTNHLVAKTLAQGLGHLGGVGVLYLGPGDDTLEAVRSSQGSGVFVGNGLLINKGGNDHYLISSPAGGVFNGDRGTCDDTPRYTQGSGFGRSTGGAAGVSGWFIDEAGNDTYALVDKALGFSETGGVGVLLELAGDDHYDARNKSLGFATAHPDFGGAGLAVFADLSGQDTYALAGYKGVGYGNGTINDDVSTPSTPIVNWINGVVADNINPIVTSSAAIFYEHAGTDTYTLAHLSRSNAVTDAHGAVGVFIDRQ